MIGCEIATNWTHLCVSVLDLTTLGKELETDLYSWMGESSFSSGEREIADLGWINSKRK